MSARPAVEAGRGGGEVVAVVTATGRSAAACTNVAAAATRTGDAGVRSTRAGFAASTAVIRIRFGVHARAVTACHPAGATDAIGVRKSRATTNSTGIRLSGRTAKAIGAVVGLTSAVVSDGARLAVGALRGTGGA